MSLSQASPLAPHPAGLLEEDLVGPAGPPPQAQLRPWALLERLRPVRLDTLAIQLHHYSRTITALRHLKQLFPEAFGEYGDLAETGWWEILAHLVSLAEEAGWWETDWSVLNEAWAWWMEEPEEQGHRLATFLHYIPCRRYGLDQQALMQAPPLELLHALLGQDVGAVSADLLVAIEMYDSLEAWSETDRTEAWNRLHRIEADPGRYPEPVRWLPELARWVCRRTGNPLLDQSAIEPWTGTDEGLWLSWASDSDVEQVKSAWRRAGPVIDQSRRLMAWYEADPSRLTLLANFLIETEEPYEQLDW